jgi:hypothetical protein
MSEASTVSLGNELSEGYEPYRAISKAAVMSVVLGVISLVTFSFPALLFLPLIGLLAGWSGYRSIRRYPAELSGRFTALAGIALCGLVLVGCVSFYSITYATDCRTAISGFHSLICSHCASILTCPCPPRPWN